MIINKYIAEMRVVVDAHKCDAMYRDNMLALIELKQYRDSGLDPEQIRELKERDAAKKIEINAGIPTCPVCGRRIVKCYDFCPDCGQRMEQYEEE